MKILLIHPLKRGRLGGKKLIKPYIPPLTIPTLAGLTPEGVNVELCDESVDEVDFNTDADLIGITGITSQINRGYDIAKAFRNKGKKVIMGGIHVSSQIEEARQFADSIVIGEAEDVWSDIIEDFQNNNLKEEYKADNYCDLKTLVIPKYELLILNRYRKSTGTNIPRLPIQATRGCPFNCNFCTVTKFWGPKIRKKPLENVERELLNIKALGTNRVFFTDDNFIADVQYTRELLKLIKKHDFTFFCQVSTNIEKHEDIIIAMGEAKCTGVMMGIESFSAESLANMNKKFNKLADYKKLFALFDKSNIQVTASLIMGLDGDNKETMEGTIQKLSDMSVNYIQLYVPALLPGTELREQYVKEDRITDYNWDNQDGTSVTFRPKLITADELQHAYWEIYKAFYSYRSIKKRIINLNNLRRGLKTMLIRLRTNIYFNHRLKYGLHPYEN